MDPFTIITALIPALTDGVRGVIGRFTKGAGAKPQNVEEVIELQEADTRRMTALAALDKPAANIAPWVANLRASIRYVMVLLIFLYAAGVTVWVDDPVTVVNAQNMMASAFFFLFGDRVYLHLKGN